MPLTLEMQGDTFLPVGVRKTSGNDEQPMICHAFMRWVERICRRLRSAMISAGADSSSQSSRVLKMVEDKVTLPGATKDAVKAMPTFQYPTVQPTKE